MDPRRNLPRVDHLAASPALDGFPERVRAEVAREAIREARRLAESGQSADLDDLLREAISARRGSMRAVINMSGVVLHTGLGRARLAPSVVDALEDVARGYTNLEFDLDAGERGDRQEHVRTLLCQLTGAEDAVVVNNAAAAVFLSLAALAHGRQVVLSRGQMVEIGGSFRLPDIVRQSGCHLVEVGCTNRTRLRDYEDAITADTAALLRCHPSNFAIIGFTGEVPAQELADLAHAHGVWTIDDQGSGLLVDATELGLPPQPTVQDSLRAGADVVLASGDKLLGGPQAGLILGRKDALDHIRRHPLARAVRVDKLTLAALAGTLQLYRDGRHLEIPALRDLAKPIQEVRDAADRLAAAVDSAVVESGGTEPGSGAAPGTVVPTWRVGLPEAWATPLRTGEPPIVGRLQHGRLWLDPRTATAEEVDIVAGRLRELAG